MHRIAISLDGRMWSICELFDHGAAISVPAVDQARVVSPTEVRRWPWEPRRPWRRRRRQLTGAMWIEDEAAEPGPHAPD